ncbi:MAG: DUF433 domain-containing protein [Hormoscilla sp. GM7CHS1pb]|nr:DUF433 domain-containing protein [Hormoscilla sp. GM7CHS1pb]
MNDLKSMVTSNPEVMLGKPAIRGTRITVELILEKLAAGREILGSHPSLPPEAVEVAVEFARNLPPSQPLAQ